MGSSAAAAITAAKPAPASEAIHIALPVEQSVPLVFVSPHSGATYLPEFLAASRLDPVTLRRSEDSFIDEIFSGTNSPDRQVALIGASDDKEVFCELRQPVGLLAG